MSQNPTAIMNQNITPVYAGLDIAKATLQLHLQNRSYDLSNTSSGHSQLIKRLAALPGAHVVCEATGGYERAVVAALQADASGFGGNRRGVGAWLGISKEAQDRAARVGASTRR